MSLAASPAPRRATRKVRVLVVDDSAVVRGMTHRWLSGEDDIDLAGVAENGEVGVKEAGRLKPDVIILDVEMPKMTGLEALPLIRKAAPGASVIMASTLTHRGAKVTIQALAGGAADYLPKPESRGLGGAEGYKRTLIEKVRGLGQAAIAKEARTKQTPAAARQPETPAQVKPARPIALATPSRRIGLRPDILVVGCSTGGPAALQVFLKPLAQSLSTPILIVQHMPKTFTAILAEHLSKHLGLDCKEAVDGEPVRPGAVRIAPGDYHMRLVRAPSGATLKLSQDPPVNFCRPAVDPLFDSAAALYGDRTLGVVLTGMGHDGREGARSLTKAGARVLVQDEASSVVWGMPGAVAEAGLASAVEPLDRLGHTTVSYLNGSGR